MNKLSFFSLIAAGMLAFSTPAFAEQVQGRVDSIDRSANTVVINDPVTGSSRTVRVHPNVIADLQNGSVVKATLKSGSDDAATFEVILAK